MKQLIVYRVTNPEQTLRQLRRADIMSHIENLASVDIVTVTGSCSASPPSQSISIGQSSYLKGLESTGHVGYDVADLGYHLE